MKKRLLAIGLCLSMIVSMAACSKDDSGKKDKEKDDSKVTEETEESEETAEPTNTDHESQGGVVFEGVWTSGRCSITITFDDYLGCYIAEIFWSGSAFSDSQWTYTCEYDSAIEGLSGEGSKVEVTYSDYGEMQYETVYDDGKANFTINDDGYLVWSDLKEGAGDEMWFVLDHMIYPCPTDEELVENYFKVVANIPYGTAGAQLKAAQAAFDVYQFASDRNLRYTDFTSFEVEMESAWAMLTEEEQENFKMNLASVSEIIYEVNFDWDNYVGVLDSVGATDTVKALVDTEGSYESWSMLEYYSYMVTGGFGTGLIEDEEWAEPDPRGQKFEGDWICDRCSISIYGEDEGYKVNVTWGNSYNSYAAWNYACYYDESIDGLSGSGDYCEVTIDEQGNETYENETYMEEFAEFTIDEDGHLIWNDTVNGRGAEMHFEHAPVVYEEELQGVG